MAKKEFHVLEEGDESKPEFASFFAEGAKIGEEVEIAPTKKEDPMMSLLKGISDQLGTLGLRMETVEKEVQSVKSGKDESFKKDVKAEDVEKAAELRKGVDPKMCEIVNEILGTDFGIELYPLGDRPGFFLNLIVPHRLNDNAVDRRPMRNKETGEYLMNPDATVKMEEYKLPDKRGKVLSTADSYDAVRQHCERVRAYMVAYYQRANRPMPTLNVQ